MSRQEFVDKHLSKWISRKLVVFIIGSFGLFFDKIDGDNWVIISSVYISLEGATSIVERILKAKVNSTFNGGNNPSLE
jgi:hypothetical protein